MTETQTAAAETVAPARRVYSEAEKAAFRKGFGEQKRADAKKAARAKAIRQYYGEKKGAEARAAARARHIGAWVAKKAAERAAAK